MEHVVITGTGIVSPVGNDTDTFFNHLLEGKSGIDRISVESFSAFPGGEVSLNTDEWKSRLGIPDDAVIPRTTGFAFAALCEAMQRAGLTMQSLKNHRVAVILGGSSSFPEVSELYRTEYESIYGSHSAPDVYGTFAHFHNGFNAAAAIAAVLQIRGAVETISNACASSAAAIGKAAELIRSGQYDIVITGGADSGIDVSTLSLFSVLNVMTKDRDAAHSCRPFSKNRTGCVVGEGAGILILESASGAAARSAGCSAEIIGCASVTDTSHITSPDMTGSSYKAAMEKTLESSIVPDISVDYINAHGTGTYYNDMLETLAIKSLFREHAYEIPVSSIKAQTGHLLSAAGAVECIAAAEALKRGILPPTVNLNEADEACNLDYVSDGPRRTEISVALSNSFGFGGQNTALLLTKG